jgi:hypothetical protein
MPETGKLFKNITSNDHAPRVFDLPGDPNAAPARLRRDEEDTPIDLETKPTPRRSNSNYLPSTHNPVPARPQPPLVAESAPAPLVRLLCPSLAAALAVPKAEGREPQAKVAQHKPFPCNH